jgi:class 3 adenylate cyclase
MLPDEIIEVQPQDVASFLGTMGENHSGTRLSEVPGGTGAGLDTALRTIMFTDMEGSTALTQRLGDEKAFELIRRHDSVVRAALADCKGCEVKHTGDGMMASFVSTRKAVECSIAIERDLAAHAERYPEHAVRVSIGLSAGEPVADNDDLFGAAVQLAARACGEAEPGQILASSVVRDLCIGKTFEFRHVGEVPLKGFAEPMPLYEVMWHQ